MRTSDIVQNLQSLVDRHNEKYGSPFSPFPRLCKAFKAYNIFMAKVRPYRLELNEGSYARLLEDLSFREDLRSILKHFGMAQRGSKLTSRDRFQDSLVKAGSDFDLLSSAKIRLETLNLKQKINDETVDSVIKRIYKSFSHPNSLSKSGGIKIASKTMHMIMPEIFIMIDKRVMKSLHSISDYYPHRDDGSWYNALTEYYGHTLNPYPEQGWDYSCYTAALVYYRRIVLEWREENNSDIRGFLYLDAQYGSTPARIIDKALW